MEDPKDPLQEIDAKTLFKILEECNDLVVLKQNAAGWKQEAEEEGVSLEEYLDNRRARILDEHKKYATQLTNYSRELSEQEVGEILTKHGVSDPGGKIAKILLKTYADAYTTIQIISTPIVQIYSDPEERKEFSQKTDQEQIQSLKEYIEYFQLTGALLAELERSGELQSQVFSLIPFHPNVEAAAKGEPRQKLEKLAQALEKAVLSKKLEIQILAKTLPELFEISGKKQKTDVLLANLIEEDGIQKAVEEIIQKVEQHEPGGKPIDMRWITLAPIEKQKTLQGLRGLRDRLKRGESLEQIHRTII